MMFDLLLKLNTISQGLAEFPLYQSPSSSTSERRDGIECFAPIFIGCQSFIRSTPYLFLPEVGRQNGHKIQMIYLSTGECLFYWSSLLEVKEAPDRSQFFVLISSCWFLIFDGTVHLFFLVRASI